MSGRLLPPSKASLARKGLTFPVIFSGSYLTNLCNPDKAKNEKSYENFLDELKVG